MELKKVVSRDGEYFWSCSTDDEFIRQNGTMALKVGAVLFAALLLLMAFTAGSPDFSLVVIICGGVLLLVAAIVALSILIMKKAGYCRPYVLRRDLIIYDRGKSQTMVAFRSVVRTEEEGNKIRLFTRFRKHLIYVPEEDYTVIRDYILARIEAEGRF